MKVIKQMHGLLMTFSLPIMMASCNPRDSQKEIGGSQDTASVNSAGGPAIRDTATINKDRRDSSKLPARLDSAKGNADPSGHIKNK